MFILFSLNIRNIWLFSPNFGWQPHVKLNLADTKYSTFHFHRHIWTWPIHILMNLAFHQLLVSKIEVPFYKFQVDLEMTAGMWPPNSRQLRPLNITIVVLNVYLKTHLIACEICCAPRPVTIRPFGIFHPRSDITGWLCDKTYIDGDDKIKAQPNQFNNVPTGLASGRLRFPAVKCRRKRSTRSRCGNQRTSNSSYRRLRIQWPCNDLQNLSVQRIKKLKIARMKRLRKFLLVIMQLSCK